MDKIILVNHTQGTVLAMICFILIWPLGIIIKGICLMHIFNKDFRGTLSYQRSNN